MLVEYAVTLKVNLMLLYLDCHKKGTLCLTGADPMCWCETAAALMFLTQYFLPFLSSTGVFSTQQLLSKSKILLKSRCSYTVFLLFPSSYSLCSFSFNSLFFHLYLSYKRLVYWIMWICVFINLFLDTVPLLHSLSKYSATCQLWFCHLQAFLIGYIFDLLSNLYCEQNHCTF